MKLCLRIVFLLCLVSPTLTQDGFDLADALGDLDPTPPKPKEQPKAPGSKDDDALLDLLDAFGADPTPPKPKDVPKVPEKPKDDGFDLEDALKPGGDPLPKPDKPAVNPPPGGGGGTFDDSDLINIGGGGGDGYKPDGGSHGGGGGGGAYNPDYDPHEAGGGQIAGIVSAVGVALLGAASSYFAYQKKKLCFKIQGGNDPEMGKGQRGGQPDNQLFSNLLRTS